MVVIVRLLGALIVVLGIIFVVSPSSMKGYLSFWRKGLRIYWIAVLRLVLGSIFLLAAPACKGAMIITILGILMLLGGVLIFVMGQKRVNAIFDWFDNQPEITVRLWALIAFGIGYLIIDAAQF